MGGEGGSAVGGNSTIERRKSSEFLQRLSIFEQSKETENPDAIFSTFSDLNWRQGNIVESERQIICNTHRMRRGPLLAETTPNGKRGRESEYDNSCETKKQRRHRIQGGTGI